jgi:hypothetical protein
MTRATTLSLVEQPAADDGICSVSVAYNFKFHRLPDRQVSGVCALSGQLAQLP